MKVFNFLAVLLLVIGGLNWFMIGAFDLNVVAHFFGYATLVTRIIYVLVGLSALYVLINFKKHL